MSLWSLLVRNSRRNYMPVSDSDDLDDLMRMAVGLHEEDDDDSLGGSNARQVGSIAHQDEPVFGSHDNLSSPSFSFMTSSVMDQGDPEAMCRIPCLPDRPKPTFPQYRWYHILLSIFVIFFFIGFTVGLGIYSLLYYYPDQLVIDMSVKSFIIPNHEAYRNLEALILARKYNSSMSARQKRDTLFDRENEMLKETQSALINLNKRHTRFASAQKETLAREFRVGSPVNSLFERVKRSTREIDCLFEYQSMARWKMHVIYLAHGDNNTNMFTKERLKTVHEIEQKIIKHPGFHKFCLRDPGMERYDPSVRSMKGCAPLNSLLTYFYPSRDVDGNVYYDGMGANIVDIESALNLAMTQESFYYYVDEKINKTFQKSHLLRSEVLFGAPLQGYSCVNDYKKDQDEKFKDFVVTYINLLSMASTDKVRVLYGGNEIFDYEVLTSFWSDVRLAIISLVAIFLLMLVLSLSIYLTIVGVIIIAVSFPISLFFYRVVFGISALGILNGAAAFVLIGIGVDDIFVFINIYRQADNMKDPVKRIWYTVKTAGVATFFTSFTTAAAFAANIASSIPAVYEFGLFMSLIVSSCWISVFVMMPPLLFLHICWFEPIEKFLISYCLCWRPTHASSQCTSSMEVCHQQQQNQHCPEVDLPLLDVEVMDGGFTDEENDDGMDEDDMLLIDDPNSGVSGGQVITNRACQITNDSLSHTNNKVCLELILQRMMMFFTDRIVIKGWYFVIGFYLVVLIASCSLMVRLKPATHPPQFFRPDTNIQQLLDLKANFTLIDTFHCDRCSGIYKVHRSKPSKTDSPRQSYTTAAPLTITNTDPPQDHIFETRPPTAVARPDHETESSDDVLDPSEDADSDSVDMGMLNSEQMSKLAPLKSLAVGTYKIVSAWASLKDKELYSTNTTQQAVEELSALGTTHPTVEELSAQDTTHPRVLSSSPKEHGSNKPIQQPGDDHHPYGNTFQTTKANSDNLQEPDKRALPTSKSSSVEENFNACKGQSCGSLKDRPLLESGATVFVVFGIKGVDRSEESVGHVLDQFKGKAIFDSKFADTFNLDFHDVARLRELCTVCNILTNQTDLVKAGSAQCLPTGMYSLRSKLSKIPECQSLPSSLTVYQHQVPAHAEGGIDSHGRLLWLAFAFESTTSEGQAYFEAYKQYQKWENLIQHIKRDVLSPDSPLQTMFQTSEFWTKVLMEVVAVDSAIYGIVLSMVICILALTIFTGHLVLLLIVVVTIIVMICCVVCIFYLAGWEMGVVEAVSLSILVGSSVDYCVHIVEGYILAGKRMTPEYISSQLPAALRKQRTSQAVQHIGVAIICSALTTIIAAVPLMQTYIQPFAKFGSILLINTFISVVMTLTLAVALLAKIAPAHFKGGWKAHLIACVAVAGVMGAVVLGLYIASTQGITIPGPSGNPLFS